MSLSDAVPVPGVIGLDHTADVGLRIHGADLPELFERAARGGLWLVLEREPQSDAEPSPGLAVDDRVDGDPTLPREVDLVEEELSLLLRSWLRVVLLWAETEGFVATDYRVALVPAPLCGAADGQAFGLRARVHGVRDLGSRSREIKGVTFHGLDVERRDDGWHAQVIFDV
jgi:SHS2 domain-containing protein